MDGFCGKCVYINLTGEEKMILERKNVRADYHCTKYNRQLVQSITYHPNIMRLAQCIGQDGKKE